MSSLFKKLNTLISAQIRDLTGSQDRPSAAPTPRPGTDLDAQIAGLRSRFDAALAYQDELQARIDGLYQEVADWDAKADQALDDGQEDQARYAIERLQFTQRNLNMADVDLREHRSAAQDLLSQINALEALFEQARQQQASSEQPPESPSERSDATAGQMLSDLLQQTQVRMQDTVAAMRDVSASGDAAETVDEAAVDDELARRLDRLRKPDSDE